MENFGIDTNRIQKYLVIDEMDEKHFDQRLIKMITIYWSKILIIICK